MFKGADSIERGYAGGEVTMTCPIQTLIDTKDGEMFWYRHDSKELSEMKANDSVTYPNGTSLNHPTEIRITFQNHSVTLRGLRLNDSGVYICVLDAGNKKELRYIKLTVNGKFS